MKKLSEQKAQSVFKIEGNQEDRTDKLQDWTVRYGENALLFHCKAENLAHAIEQCENAYPEETVVGVIADSVDSPLVYYWDAHRYTGFMPRPDAAFAMQVIDKRIESGGLMIDVSPVGGHTDDIMSLSVEINRLPDSEDDTQCVHLHFDTDNLAMSIFKQGLDRYILRTEAGVEITSTVLPNGEHAYLLR